MWDLLVPSTLGKEITTRLSTEPIYLEHRCANGTLGDLGVVEFSISGDVLGIEGPRRALSSEAFRLIAHLGRQQPDAAESLRHYAARFDVIEELQEGDPATLELVETTNRTLLALTIAEGILTKRADVLLDIFAPIVLSEEE